MKKLCTAFTFFFCGICWFESISQTIDFSALKGGDNKLKVNGGLTANIVYNATQSPNIPPISYFLGGNINFSYRNFSLPVSINYSNRRFTYSQPFSFNFVTFRPSYKWASAEIGTCFMSFSPYSLSGHQFQGVGLTLTPNKWTVSMMYGRLLKATEGSTDAGIEANYRRMGMGIKAVYKSSFYTLGVSLFNARDQANTLPNLPDNQRPQPKENMVAGLDFSTVLFKKLQLDAAYYSSTLNADKAQTSTEPANRKSLSGIFLGNNASLQSYNSYRLGLNYNLSKWNGILGIEYQKVDPDYVTLGGYYFVNDFENLTLRYSQSIWSGKINLSGNLGLQQDDIAKQKSSSQRRIVGMANLMFNPSEKLNMGVSFSNFTSYSYVRTAFDEIRKLNPFEQLDTLNYRQINQTVSANAAYTLSQSETKVNTLTADFSWMESANKQGDAVRIGQQSGFINSDILYNYQQPKKSQGIGMGINASLNTIGTQNSFSVGPLLNYQKGFLKDQLTTTGYLSYIHSKDDTPDTRTEAFNLRGNVNYKWNKNNSVSGNLGLTQVSGSSIGARTYVSLTVGYINRF
ncbi:hypothetical protein [Runella sp.]|uniref:hypothetical protein n=1 Tax=Runella sp. TaxID=1960881 RepID=UPI003D0C1033